MRRTTSPAGCCRSTAPPTAGWVSCCAPARATRSATRRTPDPRRSGRPRWIEYAEVLTRLWESFPRAALIGDQDGPSSSTTPLSHRSTTRATFYRVAGPLDGPSSVQGRPVLAADRCRALGWDAVAARADVVLVSADEAPTAADARCRGRCRARRTPAPRVALLGRLPVDSVARRTPRSWPRGWPGRRRIAWTVDVPEAVSRRSCRCWLRWSTVLAEPPGITLRDSLRRARADRSARLTGTGACGVPAPVPTTPTVTGRDRHRLSVAASAHGSPRCCSASAPPPGRGRSHATTRSTTSAPSPRPGSRWSASPRPTVAPAAPLRDVVDLVIEIARADSNVAQALRPSFLAANPVAGR